jgi:hypothetical protein
MKAQLAFDWLFKGDARLKYYFVAKEPAKFLLENPRRQYFEITFFIGHPVASSKPV